MTRIGRLPDKRRSDALMVTCTGHVGSTSRHGSRRSVYTLGRAADVSESVFRGTARPLRQHLQGTSLLTRDVVSRLIRDVTSRLIGDVTSQLIGDVTSQLNWDVISDHRGRDISDHRGCDISGESQGRIDELCGT